LKNTMANVDPKENKTTKVMPHHGSLKMREDVERSELRKREHKSLMKSLTMAQISTASMGKFDKKAGKKGVEPDAPKS